MGVAQLSPCAAARQMDLDPHSSAVLCALRAATNIVTCEFLVAQASEAVRAVCLSEQGAQDTYTQSAKAPSCVADSHGVCMRAVSSMLMRCYDTIALQ
jgi:hypothetical protein